MMSDQWTLKRRNLISTLAAGAVLGGIWGAAFPALATESRPTLAVVGHRSAQLILIDSSKARALVMVGHPDDQLLDALPAMMTVFRQRIDLIIGSQDALEQHAISIRDRWSIQHAIAFQEKSALPTLAMPTTVASNTVSIALGTDMSLNCLVGHRGEWSASGSGGGDPLWAIHVTHPVAEISIAPSVGALEAAGTPPADVLIVPEPASTRPDRFGTSQAIAVNYDSDVADEEVPEGLRVTRVFPRDIARFVFEDDKLRLPPWSKSAGTAHSR